MIGAIAGKELRECRRDGRVQLLAGRVALLVLVSLVTGWSTRSEQERRAHAAQRGDQAAFLRQGEKPPHAAAHFGRMAYKPVAPLAVFDPGAAPFLGQVIWLEAHTRNPAMFRPAEDAPELRRLWDLSVAGVLTLLVPLLAFAIGFGCFAAERERGTLRQVISTGVRLDRLFAGKIAVVAGVAIAVSLVAVLVSVVVALCAPGGMSTGNILVRGAGLALGYGCYGLACAAVALLVSALSRSATSALLVLLAIWAVSFVILPRIAASVAERISPAPDSGAFWAGASRTIRANRPARDSRDYRSAERLVLGRALGREVTAAEAASMDVNRAGLSMEISELSSARAYAEAYRDLYAAYGEQRRARRLLSALSPAIALQHLSSALAGTDVAAHEHFALEAERQRNTIIRAMNEEMMLRGVGQGFAYLADADFWASIPDFTYRPPPAAFAVRAAAWDLLVLGSWAVLALWLARRAARRQRVI